MTRQLPTVLRIIQAEAGLEAVLRCAKALGGKQIFIGRNPPDNHPLVLAAGRKAADAVAARLMDERIDFPRANAFVRRLIAFDLFREGGVTLNMVAERTGLCRAQVKRYHKDYLAAVQAGEEAAPLPRPRKRDTRQLDIEDFT